MQEILLIILDAYIVWIIVYFILSFFLGSKRVFKLFIIAAFIYLLTWLTGLGNLDVSHRILTYASNWLPLFVVVVLSPDIRRGFETAWVVDSLQEGASFGSQETKTHIVEAAMYLSSQNIGALITIEKYNSLDQYADRAIIMNAIVSKELLINIFIPNTPLHDGAVIIRGDEIRCAGAYYTLSETEKHDKTMGSRHRAALGISEITDSLTIVVSEETGNISIVIEGIMIRANDREKMYEYINMYIK